MNNYNNKVAVVTGANKGIGYAIVKELSKKFNGLIYLTGIFSYIFYQKFKFFYLFVLKISPKRRTRNEGIEGIDFEWRKYSISSIRYRKSREH